MDVSPPAWGQKGKAPGLQVRQQFQEPLHLRPAPRGQCQGAERLPRPLGSRVLPRDWGPQRGPPLSASQSLTATPRPMLVTLSHWQSPWEPGLRNRPCCGPSRGRPAPLPLTGPSQVSPGREATEASATGPPHRCWDQACGMNLNPAWMPSKARASETRPPPGRRLGPWTAQGRPLTAQTASASLRTRMVPFTPGR